MTLSHKILDLHDAICWDMDGTLVETRAFPSPNAQFFRQYIMDHPEKRHIVLTFRDYDWAQEIYEELEEYGFDSSCISEIINCPSEIHDAYAAYHHVRREEYIPHVKQVHGLTDEQMAANVELFPKWKGQAVKKAGCTILVDDMPHWTLPGCQESGVDLMHSHTLELLCGGLVDSE